MRDVMPVSVPRLLYLGKSNKEIMKETGLSKNEVRRQRRKFNRSKKYFEGLEKAPQKAPTSSNRRAAVIAAAATVFILLLGIAYYSATF